jgi:hypothetical protein
MIRLIMRLQNYILESKDKNEMISFIKKNCKPYIKLAKRNGIDNFLFRGISSTKEYIIKDVRTDRRPTDMNEYVHKQLDKIFKEKFGWKARSNSLFCVPSESRAIPYGYLHVVIPIGNFDYLWSPKSKDLYMEIKKLPIIDIYAESKFTTIRKRYKKIHGWNPKKFIGFMRILNQKIENFVDDMNFQKNKGFKTLMTNYKKHEVMINCKKYIAVNADDYNFDTSSLWDDITK